MKTFLFVISFLFVFSTISFSQTEVQNPSGNSGTFWRLLGNPNTDTAIHFVGTTDNRALTFRTNNIRRTTISSTGNVGIGTIAPAHKLDIVAPGNAIGIRLLSGNASEFAYLSIGRNTEYAQIGACTAGSFFLDAQDGDMAIKNFNTGKILLGASLSANAHMSIITNGNVGINTVNPQQRLHVAGATTGVRFDGLGTGGSFITAPSANTDRLLFADANGVVRAISNGTTNQVLGINTAGVPTWANGNFWSLSGNTLTGTELLGSTNAQPVIFISNNIQRMRINATDGEVVAGAAASPYTGDLVCGVGNAILPFAVNGYTAQNGSGVWGETLPASTSGFSSVQGVYTGSGSGAGVLGNYAGTSTLNTRRGVLGVCSSPSSSNAGVGVYGINNAGSGSSRMGVLGLYTASAGPPTYGIGVIGIAAGGAIPAGNFDYGVVGWRQNNQDYSGYFNGNHVIANGTKSASVGTSLGNQLLYVMESPEVWFEDFGSSKLQNGKCKVDLDPLFLETVVIDDKHPMHVFIQLEGEADDVYIEKGTTSFTVVERKGGQSNVPFSWRVVAKRVHFQDHRFGNDPVWGPGDTRHYMEYCEPPKIDYNQNLILREAKKQTPQKSPVPAGFITYEQILKEAQDAIKYASKPQTLPTNQKQ